MCTTQFHMFVLAMILLIVVQTVEAGHTKKLQYTPGVLLRDLLTENTEATEAPLSPDDLLKSDDSSDWNPHEYRIGDRDPAIDNLLASLTELGIQSEKPSAHFLLGLYERLQQGQDLPAAAGHTHDDNIKQADTIRSFTAQGNNLYYNTFSPVLFLHSSLETLFFHPYFLLKFPFCFSFLFYATF